MDLKLLEILVCPICKSGITYDQKQQTLNCKACQLAYPIEDDIPVMLASRAVTLTENELQK